MRTIYFFVILFICSSLGYSQKEDCSVQIRNYQEFLNVKNFEEALAPWEFVVEKCPSVSENIYKDGLLILQYKIDTTTEDQKEQWVKKKLELLDQYYKYFPELKPAYKAEKAMVYVNNGFENKPELFSWLDESFTTAFDAISDALTINTYFTLLTEKYEKGNSKITKDYVLEKYLLLRNKAKNLELQNTNERGNYVALQRSLKGMAEPITTCENLSDYFEKNYSDKQENQVWLSASLDVLKEKCAHLSVFLTLAKQNFSINENSEAAGYLALASLRNKKFDEAAKYYLLAAELESNPSKKSELYYDVASIIYGNDRKKAVEMLKKSLEHNPKYGKAYIYLSQLYSNAGEECTKNDFEKKALYYLAIQTAKKAAQAEPMYKANADHFEKEFADKSLSKKDISNAKLNGKSIKIGCWINETITFPAK